MNRKQYWRGFKGACISALLPGGAKLLAVSLFLFLRLVSVDSAIAADSDSPPPRTAPATKESVSIYESQYEATFGPGLNNPLDSFNSWSQAYQSHERTPILFYTPRLDAGDQNGRVIRKYPVLSFDQHPGSNGDTRQESQERGFRRYNLGVDDEVTKSSIAVLQPVHKMHADIAWDVNERDRFLNLFKTTNAIAEMTLHYLDKSVGASLDASYHRFNEATQSQIQKQISWTSYQVAHPNRTEVMLDVDEKVEACMRFGDKAFAQTGRVQLDCNSECLVEGQRQPPASGQGRFGYCVCCAQVTAKLNQGSKASHSQGVDSSKIDYTYRSIVDQVLFGSLSPEARCPLSGAEQGKGEQYLACFRDEIRFMYGDVITSPCGKHPLDTNFVTKAYAGNDNSVTCSEGTLKTEFFYPRFSVADRIAFFRDGACEKSPNGTVTSCPYTSIPIKEGICPAVVELLQQWPLDDSARDSEKVRRLWVQASLGETLMASNFENMAKLAAINDRMGDPAARRALSLKQFAGNLDTKFRRWLSNWCDATAIAAFKRYHLRMIALVEDHLTLNQRATDHQKAQLRGLISRVTLDLELAERDFNAYQIGRRQMAGLTAEANILDQSNLAVLLNTNESRQRAENMFNSVGGPLGNPQFRGSREPDLSREPRAGDSPS